MADNPAFNTYIISYTRIFIQDTKYPFKDKVLHLVKRGFIG